MLEDTININNLCFEIEQFSGSEKKLVKPLGKNCFFGPNLHRKGVIMEFIFFGRNNNRSSVFRKFLFYQNIICFDWVMNLFLSSVIFLSKKCHFQLKQLWLWNERKEQLRDFNVPWNFEPIWACFTVFTRLLEKMKDNFPHLHWLDERIFEFLERKLRPMHSLVLHVMETITYLRRITLPSSLESIFCKSSYQIY